jgi:hypothetical protein
VGGSLAEQAIRPLTVGRNNWLIGNRCDICFQAGQETDVTLNTPKSKAGTWTRARRSRMAATGWGERPGGMRMDRQRLRRLVRHFPEHGLKVLLENPGNVRNLLQLLAVRAVPRFDFTQMQVEPAQFVQRDYRHLESDVVLRAPLRVGRRGRTRWITIYILIEHQSEPDRFMVYRALE